MKKINNKNRKLENLIKFIEEKITYDSVGGEYCPFCKKAIKKPNYWIDKKTALASNINRFLGFKSGSWDDDKTEGMIFRAIDDFHEVTGNKKIDAE